MIALPIRGCTNDSEEPNHASDHDHRSRHCEVGFQVHGVNAEGNVILRRQLKRRYVLAFFQNLSPCLVGIEACASSHHWSRKLQALGHTVRLMPPAYEKPYVKRHKNDARFAAPERVSTGRRAPS
jgi:transposase